MRWAEVYYNVVHSSKGKEFKEMELVLDRIADLSLASDQHLRRGPFLKFHGILFP